MSETDLYGAPLPLPTPGTSPGTVPTPTPRPLVAGMDDDDRLGFFFAQVDAVRAERVSNAYIEVSRLIDGTKKYVGRGDVASFDLETLASKWGTGRYSLQLRVGRTYRTGINVEVEGGTPAGGVQPSLHAPGVGGPASGEAAHLLQFMSTQLAAQQAMTLELIKANSAKPPDSFKDALLSQLLEASLSAKSGVGQIAQAMELVDRIKGSGGGGGDDGTEGLGKLAGIVERVLSTRRPAAPVGGPAPRPSIPAPAQPAAQAPAQVAAVQATNVASSSPAAPAPAAAFVLPVLEEFERTTGVPIVKYCRALVASIDLGTDAETAGILLYRLTIASPALPAIRATLGEIEADKAAAQLVEGCPALAGQLQYVTQAVEALLQLVEGDDTPATGGEA